MAQQDILFPEGMDTAWPKVEANFDEIYSKKAYSPTKAQVDYTPEATGDQTVLKFLHTSAAHSALSVYTQTSAGTFPYLSANSYLDSGNPTRFDTGKGSAGMLMRPTGTIEFYTHASANPTLAGIIDANHKLTMDQFAVTAMNTAPSSATDTGTLGEIRVTSTHIYVCTATNVWVRVAIATW